MSSEGAAAGERIAIVPWMRVSAALFAVAWGGNEFTPLLVMYRQIDQMSAFSVNVLLGAYVLGIVPALLLGGPLSDRYGRRPLFVPAPIIAIAGSTLLAVGASSMPILFAGRVLSGIALGLVMAVGTSWVKELSEPPFTTRAVDGRGPERAAQAQTSRFARGPRFAAPPGPLRP
ncbi:MAG: MFS transporter, partial [Brachybacterium sp.]|nr:MFS transporter [Brachybacterium sp.]